jgi:hypothetical protein
MATVRAYPLTGADQAVSTGQGTYWGLALRETAGSAAVVRVFDGTSAAGTVIDTISLAANGAASTWLHGGIRFAAGVYVDVVSGSVEGSARIG